jgi:hypothetical protein
VPHSFPVVSHAYSVVNTQSGNTPTNIIALIWHGRVDCRIKCDKRNHLY